MSEDRYGERVNLSDISSNPIQGSLPHPKDPWQGAQAVDQPFKNSAPAAGGAVGADTNYSPRGVLRDPLGEAQAAVTTKPQEVKSPPIKEARGPRPVPQATAPTRKETATLSRFREIFSLQRIKVVDATISRRDPVDPSLNVEMTFGLRGINFEDYQWVLAKFAENAHSSTVFNQALKHAFVSMAVASIEGEPIWKVFGFEPQKPEDVRDPMYPHIGLRFQAAEALSEELRTTMHDLIEGLWAEVESKIDSRYLPTKKAKTQEPEEGASGPLPLTESES